jgi:Flp pilus assembly protein TadD
MNFNASPLQQRQSPASDVEVVFREGVAAWNSGRREEAVGKLDAALRARPEYPEALAMAGYVLGELGKPQAAIDFYFKALGLNDKLPAIWANAGKAFFTLRRHRPALDCFNSALALTPHDADLWNCRAGALRELGDMEQSEDNAREALRLRPEFAEAAINLGNALLKQDRIETALETYQRAQVLAPNNATALCGQALCHRALGQYEQALSAFEAGERLGSKEAMSGKGCLHLLLGNFAKGFEGYEHRWISGRSLSDALGARFPVWRGPGGMPQRVLVLNDHGLGDTIQFSRYLPLIAATGAKLAFCCAPPLRRLLRGLGDFPYIEPSNIGADFDAQIAISSLPRAFGTHVDSAPSPDGYLQAEPHLQAKWAQRIKPGGFKIGIVWQGNPNPEADRARSFPLLSLQPLAALTNVRLISLQKGEAERQIDNFRDGLRVETLGPECDAGADAFIDTAAAMMSLDLVVTCDTSVAHLAGALGRPVWLALKRDAEWRWLLDRSDSPWYASMRLFRQARRGDWGTVFAAMADALRKLA